MQIPFLPQDKIAHVAQKVLDGYSEKTGRPVKPPIPVEDIISNYLGLGLRYLDLEKAIKIAGVLGATFVPKKLIAVDNSLLTGHSQGRAAFTLAHEVGHWMLHRQYAKAIARSDSSGGVIFCRAKDAKKPIEWQADYFAGCLLMPEQHVRQSFKKTFEPDYLDIINTKKSFSSSFFCFDICAENWPRIADAVCAAGEFDNVSRQAMIIRLQELGLVINHTPDTMGWRQGLATA